MFWPGKRPDASGRKDGSSKMNTRFRMKGRSEVIET